MECEICEDNYERKIKSINIVGFDCLFVNVCIFYGK